MFFFPNYCEQLVIKIFKLFKSSSVDYLQSFLQCGKSDVLCKKNNSSYSTITNNIKQTRRCSLIIRKPHYIIPITVGKTHINMNNKTKSTTSKLHLYIYTSCNPCQRHYPPLEKYLAISTTQSFMLYAVFNIQKT